MARDSAPAIAGPGDFPPLESGLCLYRPRSSVAGLRCARIASQLYRFVWGTMKLQRQSFIRTQKKESDSRLQRRWVFRRPLIEMLEARQMLDASGFAGNDCPPDLNLDAVPTQTVTVGQTLSLNVLTAGGTLVDLDQSGNPTGDALRVVLDPDVGTDTPVGAAITVGGDFTWTPTAGQVGEHTIVVIAIDQGTPALADAETTGRRHAVSQGANKVMIHFGHRVFVG